jgi:hypothetical protein
MMDLVYDRGELHVRLQDDVWGMGEPGTLILTRTQVQVLRSHLNSLVDTTVFQEDGEDG